MKAKFIGVAALCLAGCGQRSTTVDYHADGGQTITIADAKNGGATAEIGAAAAMPTDLPAWTPQYPGSTIMMAQVQNQAAGHGRFENVAMQSSDSLPKISAFYDQRIAAAGLKSMHSVSAAEVSTRMVEMPSGIIISVAVTKNEDGGSLISISRMNKD